MAVRITASPHWICTAHFLGESVSVIVEQSLGSYKPGSHLSSITWHSNVSSLSWFPRLLYVCVCVCVCVCVYSP